MCWPANLAHANARWTVAAEGSKLDLIQLAGHCFSIWDGGLSETLCPWTPSVFEPCGIAEGGAARRNCQQGHARQRAKLPK